MRISDSPYLVVLVALHIVEVLHLVQRRALQDETAPADAEQVQGRAPGSSDHASPIRRTEARAERTLDPARTETASARECGSAFPSRAPEPSAARVG